MEAVGPGIPFRVGEEKGHAQIGCELTHADHPPVGLRHDPIGANSVLKCVPADTEFRGNNPGGSLGYRDRDSPFEELSVFGEITRDWCKVEQSNAENVQGKYTC